MTTIRAKVTQNGITKAKVTPQQEILVTDYKFSSNELNISDLGDVDTTQLTDGALLVYNGTTTKWQALDVIENQNTEVNGGHF